MPRVKFGDLTGKKFHMYTFLKKVKVTGSNGNTWLCKCDCGVEKVVIAKNVIKGTTHSCGCHKASAVAVNRKHGMTFTPEWKSWTKIKERCFNKKCPEYKNYGGRGVTLCEEWRQDFKLFLEEVGLKPSPDHSIERINNDGNYEPGNVRWATRLEQANNKRSNIPMYLNGEKMSLAQYCKETGMPYAALYNRLHNGWTVERALKQPFRKSPNSTSSAS